MAGAATTPKTTKSSSKKPAAATSTGVAEAPQATSNKDIAKSRFNAALE